MATDTIPTLPPMALGFRALRGGAVVVGVTLKAGEPRVVRSSFLATTTEGDRLSLEPYTVAFEMARTPDKQPSAGAIAAVAEGRRRQDRHAADGLADIVRQVTDAGYAPVVAALLVNRAGWITDLLAHSLSAPEHPAVAEGLAVRDALRFALGRAGLATREIDEKALTEQASQALRLSTTEIDAHLKALGAEVGPPWRKEQKLAALAAWLSLTTAAPV